jgi:hypothetical protein
MAMFEGFISPQVATADLCLVTKTQVASASILKVPLIIKPMAEMTFRMVSKLGLRFPDKSL